MEEKHTLGPLVRDGHTIYGPVHSESRYPTGRICIARVLRAGTERADPQLEGGADRFGFDSEADARLIAAAPDLLEALEKIPQRYMDDMDAHTPGAAQLIRFAIAKATKEPA